MTSKEYHLKTYHVYMWQAPFLEFYHVRIGQDFPQDIFFQDVLLEFLQFAVENPDHHVWSLCGVLSLVD